MNLGEFLHYCGTGAGAGVVVWAIIHFIDSTGAVLTPQMKFWGALLLSLAVPLAALALEVALGLGAWTSESVFEALSAAYAVSQIVHWGTGGAAQAEAMDVAERGIGALEHPPAPDHSPS